MRERKEPYGIGAALRDKIAGLHTDYAFKWPRGSMQKQLDPSGILFPIDEVLKSSVKITMARAMRPFLNQLSH